MKKFLIALALVASPIASFASESNGIGYTHLQLDYIHGRDLQGAGISGSYALSDHFFATGSYTGVNGADSWGNRTNKSWTLGLGFNTPLGARTDWVSELAYAHHDRSGDSLMCSTGTVTGTAAATNSVTATTTATAGCWPVPWSHDISGYNIGTGVRHRFTDKLTGNAYLGYEHYGHYDGGLIADVSVGYHFNPTWSVQAGARATNEDQSVRLGVRASF